MDGTALDADAVVSFSGVAVVALLLLAAVYLSWTAGRLDRMHVRVDAAWAALDAQLARRAAAARVLVGALPPGPAAELDAAAHAALEPASQPDREVVENDLSRVLRAVLPLLDAGADTEELRSAVNRVRLARAFYNTAVRDTLALRRRWVPRLFHLAGHRGPPAFFEIDDTALGAPAAEPGQGSAERA